MNVSVVHECVYCWFRCLICWLVNNKPRDSTLCDDETMRKYRAFHNVMRDYKHL